MRTTDLLSILLSLFNFALSTPLPQSTPLPLIIWHGLGDKFDNEGIQSVATLAARIHPGTKTHIIRLSDDPAADQRATFFGNISSQIETVCTSLSSKKWASANNTRIDALGFSQGGQFLRGLVERCPGISVRSLVTFGSQHNGIAEFQKCGTWDLLCKGASGAVKGGAWSDFVQGGIVPAQYYREVNESTGLGSEAYLNGSHFLADVNNEREVKNEIYKERIAALDNFAMYVFENDTTVVPRESGWFAEVNKTDGRFTPLRERKMYLEDWVGLKELDEKGGLTLRTVKDAKHMELTTEVLIEAMDDFFGVEKNALDWDSSRPASAQGVLLNSELR